MNFTLKKLDMGYFYFLYFLCQFYKIVLSRNLFSSSKLLNLLAYSCYNDPYYAVYKSVGSAVIAPFLFLIVIIKLFSIFLDRSCSDFLNFINLSKIILCSMFLLFILGLTFSFFSSFLET